MEIHIVDFNSGNWVIDFVINALVVILQVGIWCLEKILTNPILTLIALVVIFILCAINTTIDIEIRGNLWKWRNK